MTGFPWLKLWNEAPDDPKWLAAADMAGSTRPVVFYTFTKCLTHANANDDRGSIAGLHPQVIASWCGVDVSEVHRIFQAFRELGILVGDRIAKWSKRQVERVLSPVAARVAKHRQKKADEKRQGNLDIAAASVTRSVTSGVTGTPGMNVQDIENTNEIPAPLDEESDKERPPVAPPRGAPAMSVVRRERSERPARRARQGGMLFTFQGGDGAGDYETVKQRRARERLAAGDRVLAETAMAFRLAATRSAAGFG